MAKQLTTKEQLTAILGVAKLSFKIAPGAVMFKLAGAVIDAVLPIATTYYAALTTTALVDAYAGNTAAGSLALRYVLITAVLGFILTVWRSLDTYIQAKMRYLVEAKISDKMYVKFLSLEFWRYDDKDTVDLYDRALKFSNFFAWIFSRIAEVASQLIGVLSAVIALALFEPLMALIVLLGLLPGIVLQFRLSRKQVNHWNENVEVRRARNLLEWPFGQPRLISELRLYGMVRYLLKHRNVLREKDEKGRLDFERQFIPSRLAADALETIIEVGALIWITLQIISRNQPVGQFVYVQQLVSRAVGSASGFASTLANIDEDIANLFDYEQFMKLPSDESRPNKLTQTPKLIEFKDVSFSYPGAKSPALNTISLTISAHEHIALVGQNGAGKTTFIKLLCGLYKPTTGTILIDGVDLQTIDIPSWHKQLGVLQQEFMHYNFATAGDNVRFGDVGATHSEEKLSEALRQAEAYDFIEKLPQKRQTYVNPWMEDSKGNKGVDLSGGQWQRLALARNFYRNAPIIILDEPTSAIDALAEARIFKRLFKESKRTLITISHRMSTVERADRIYMFELGKLVESGTHKELAANQAAYYKMFESQMS